MRLYAIAWNLIEDPIIAFNDISISPQTAVHHMMTSTDIRIILSIYRQIYNLAEHPSVNNASY